MTSDTASRPDRIRWIAWGLPAGLIGLPLAALKLVDPAAWEMGDLPAVVVMILVIGLLFEAATRLPARWTYGAGILVGLGTAGLLILGNLAVGFAGSEDNAINGLFMALPVLALCASVFARFRPSGLSKAFVLTAIGQMAAGLAGFTQGYFTGPLTVTFSALWLAAALLFRRSAREGRTARGDP